MSQRLQNLSLVSRIPEDLKQREPVINRAMDVRSACMLYLAHHIPHEMLPLGAVGKMTSFPPPIKLGKVIKTFFVGDKQLADASDCLKDAVAKYGDAVNSCQFEVCLSLHQKMEGSRSRNSVLIK